LAIVIGIDPGSSVTGWGVVEKNGSRILYRDSGVIRTSRKSDRPNRLSVIKNALDEVIREHSPDAAAVEDVFLAKNPRSALKLGETRGVILLSAAEAGVEVFEYSPREVKGSVTGVGSAHKSQVAAMVVKLLAPGHEPASEDETDALAVAFCHALRMMSPGRNA